MSTDFVRLLAERDRLYLNLALIAALIVVGYNCVPQRYRFLYLSALSVTFYVLLVVFWTHS